MLNSQKIDLRRSEIRSRLSEISALEGDNYSDEIKTEEKNLHAEIGGLEQRYKSAILAEDDEQRDLEKTVAGTPDAEQRERIELRSKAKVSSYVMAALSGRQVDGAESELRAAAGISDGIPLEAWDVPRGTEKRVDVATDAPSTVGVNLDVIRPAVFANSIAPRLGVEMPRVQSGSYASATIATSLTAGAKGKGAPQESTEAVFTVTSATPKRISARLSVQIEDIASVGTASFESALRQNLSLVLSDELDKQMITGNGSGNNLTGIFERLTSPSDPTPVSDFDSFVAAFSSGVDGLWSQTLKEVSVVCGPETYRFAAETFRDAAGQDLGSISAADYSMANTGGFWTNKRMPDAVSNIQQAILYRMGRSMAGAGSAIRTAVCPHWNSISIDDIFSDSASGTRHFTMHVLLGNVILTQPDAYEQVAFKLA